MRALVLAMGILALAGAWLGPLPQLAEHTFWAHMTMHMIVVAVAAPLIAIAIAGTRLDPVRVRPALFPAIPISLVELFVVWAWHAPALHRSARHELSALFAEQLLFLVSGLLLWLAALGGERARRRERAGAGLAALLLTSMHMTLLGALLALTPRALYGHASLEDQHLGGAIMLLAGGASYLAGGLRLAFELVRVKP